MSCGAKQRCAGESKTNRLDSHTRAAAAGTTPGFGKKKAHSRSYARTWLRRNLPLAQLLLS